VKLTSVKFGNDAVTVPQDATDVDIDVSGKNAGTYTITVEARDKKFTADVVIKNTQESATVKVTKSEYTGDATAAGVQAMLATNAEFYYNGKKLEKPTITVADSDIKVNGTQVYVGTVKVQVTNSKGTQYDVNATVNATFTVK